MSSRITASRILWVCDSFYFIFFRSIFYRLFLPLKHQFTTLQWPPCKCTRIKRWKPKPNLKQAKAKAKAFSFLLFWFCYYYYYYYYFPFYHKTWWPHDDDTFDSVDILFLILCILAKKNKQHWKKQHHNL